MKKTQLILSLYLIISACNREKINADFYYWKSIYSSNSVTDEMLKEMHSKNLYLKYFDVILKDGTIQPVSKIQFQCKPDTSLTIVPVVYIQNKVLSQLQEGSIDTMAHNILHLIETIDQANNITIQSIQFDCDWTIQTKDAYFQLLKSVRKIFQHKISATIRLHQIKYAYKTGIPPVDQGVLMYYNMGTIATDHRNSIYDRNIGLKYLPYLSSYSLPLDIALTIFHWGVQMRDNKVVNVIGRLGEEQLRKEKAFELKHDLVYQCKNAGFYFGRYWRENDSVKVEKIQPNDLSEMISDLDKYLHKENNHYILYDLDANNASVVEQYLH